GGGEEVAPALPGPLRPTADQPQVGLVDQRRGLERLAGLLLRQLPGGQLAQLVVDQRQELLGRLAVALPDRREEAGEVVPGRGPPTNAPGQPRLPVGVRSLDPAKSVGVPLENVVASL